MKIKILFAILIYYTFLGLFFSMGSAYYGEYSNPIDLNSSNITSGEIDTGGVFTTGVHFLRFLGLVTTGIGLPSDVPSWFQILFAAWQILVLIFTIALIISMAWDG